MVDPIRVHRSPMKTEAGLDLVWVAADGFPLRATERKLILFPTRMKRNNAQSAVVAPAALKAGCRIRDVQ
jgi:hypothetical protein